jgi:hypothetical protein
VQADGSTTGATLADLVGFGRLHGVIKDPFNMYVNANFFAPTGGYNGIIDTETKEAIALFRVTKYNRGGSDGRSIHMSFWTTDGSAIILANLHGKAVERIDVTRDKNNKIVGAAFNRAASLGLGQDMTVVEEATFFQGYNAFGNPLIGGITGEYAEADLGDLTPSNVCKENGCPSGVDGLAGGRGNNLVICPIPSLNGLVYTTLAGGGLFILDSSTTPMSIVGEYGKGVVYGAGCAGIQTGDTVFVDSGVSASPARATQSMFGLYAFDDTAYANGNQGDNVPMPIRVYQDEGNTRSSGNVESVLTSNDSGQLPFKTTRRDAHGAWSTGDEKFVHVVDRIQNVVEVFDTTTFENTNTYDLVSQSGKSGRKGPASMCFQRSVLDDPDLPLADPAPDLVEITPDGKYFMIAFRGPAPVSVPHGAQGSCPGVGIVEITEKGNAGRLVDVLRTTNTVDDHVPTSIPGGHLYTGKERAMSTEPLSSLNRL